MPPIEAPKLDRRTTRTNRAEAADPALLTDFFKTQAEAIEAARSNGIEEMVITFRPNAPGARNVKAKIRTEDVVRLWAGPMPGDAAEKEPSGKLARAIKEAAEVTKFYKKKEELFDALERQG